MNKIIFSSFIFLLITTYSHSDYLINSDNNCAYDLVPYQDNSGYCYTLRSTGVTYCNKSLSYDDFRDGYTIVDGSCVMKNDLLVTGLTQNQWNYLLAVLAHVLGFTMLFLINYLSILVSKGRS